MSQHLVESLCILPVNHDFCVLDYILNLPVKEILNFENFFNVVFPKTSFKRFNKN